MAGFTFDPEEMRPLLDAAAEAAVRKFAAEQSPISDSGKLLYTESEVAERLSVSPSALKKWRLAGEVSVTVQSHGLVRYTSADIEGIIARLARGHRNG